MAPPTQRHRILAVGTPLGADVLLLESMTGQEAVSRPFLFELEMLSQQDTIDFKQLLGHNLTVRLALPGNATRYFNGFVSTIRQMLPRDGFARYRAELVPWFWFLTRTSDCRIFQKLAVPDIVAKVFQDHGFSHFKLALAGTYQPRDFCVQYRETDFNFVSRLLEEEGIFYYFTHDNGKHTLVLADDLSACSPFPGYDRILFRGQQQQASYDEVIHDWVMQDQVQPIAYALNDYDFEAPRKALRTASQIPRQDGAPALGLYDYPGGYTVHAQGEHYARVRVEEQQASYHLQYGQANARGIAPGHTFLLADHPRPDQAVQHLVLQASYALQADDYGSSRGGGADICACSFTAMPTANGPYRPPRLTPKPIVQGPQTAIVVGPAGEELYTDKYGRVKVQFHWDRYGKADEQSSCWIRVAQVWAGTNWGAMYIPRIGQEVIVEFLEGDPDTPIITGRVYNGQAMPPYELPANKTRSTLKSNTSPDGAGFNEFRYEDKKGKEQIFIHAQRNMDIRVRNDHLTRIYGNRHEIVGWEKDGQKGGDLRFKVHQDHHEDTERDHFERIGGDEHRLIEGDRLAQIDGNHDLTVGGDRKTKVDGDDHHDITGNDNRKIGMALSTQAGTDMHTKAGKNYALEAGMQAHLKAGMTMVIEAGMQLTLKAGAGFITIGPAGVDISGPLVKINSGGAAGSGSGAKPTAPQKAAKPKKPKTPNQADTATAGKPDKAEGKADKTKKSKLSSTAVAGMGTAPAAAGGKSAAAKPPPSPAAAVLKAAAQDGTPFCEVCPK